MRAGMKACPGPRCLTEIPEDRELCHFCRRTLMRFCRKCNKHRDPLLFALARPRKDGTRHPMTICVDCVAARDVLRGEAHRLANREYMRRIRREARIAAARSRVRDHRRIADGGVHVNDQRKAA